MKPAYDTSSPKRAVNLTINADLITQARMVTGNLSAQVETLLADFVQRQCQLRSQHRAELQHAAHAWQIHNERHGAFADEFSTL